MDGEHPQVLLLLKELLHSPGPPVHLHLSLQSVRIGGVCSGVTWILAMPRSPGDSQDTPVGLWPFEGTQ